jgi:hypothetical protein
VVTSVEPINKPHGPVCFIFGISSKGNTFRAAMRLMIGERVLPSSFSLKTQQLSWFLMFNHIETKIKAVCPDFRSEGNISSTGNGNFPLSLCLGSCWLLTDVPSGWFLRSCPDSKGKRQRTKYHPASYLHSVE